MAQHRPAFFETHSSLGPVRPGHDLDIVALQQYLVSALPGLFSPPPHPNAPLTVQQFAHGQSNPTFLIEWGGSRLVLRKKPPGTILASAHAVEREFTVISALAATRRVPVPRPLALCEDPSVLGTPFYLMEEARGTIYLDPNLPTLVPQQRAAVYRAMANTLAAIHSVDPLAVGLGSYGGASSSSKAMNGPNGSNSSSGGGYCRRQLRRWTAQYEASVSPKAGGKGPMPAVQQLVAWLNTHVPAEDDLYSGAQGGGSGASSSSLSQPRQQCVCHGDFRLDNLVVRLHPTSGSGSGGGSGVASSAEVVAVLDWELSTLGNPWADVAYCCLPYHFPSDLPSLRALAAPLPAGVPQEREFLDMYCRARGIPGPPPPMEWSFYLGLSLFRLTAILAGVQARSRAGNASSAQAAAVSSDAVQHMLASAALRVVGLAGGTAGTAPFAAAGSSSSNGRSPVTHSVVSSPAPGAACSCSGTCACRGCNAPGAGAKSCDCSPSASSKNTLSYTPSRSGSGSNHSTSTSTSVAASASMVAAAEATVAASAAAAPPEGVPQGLWLSGRALELRQRLVTFMEAHVMPAEAKLEAFADEAAARAAAAGGDAAAARWSVCPLMEELKEKAKQAGLWNMWLPAPLAQRIAPMLERAVSCPARRALLAGPGLTNLEYAHLCEVTGRSVWAPEIFNCGAPDTGNMEVLAKYGTLEQQERWLLPLLSGDIRSCFGMTEKGVASSDATNIQSTIKRSACGRFLHIQGRKWWTSGAQDPRCKICIFMGKTDTSAPTHKQQSMVLVPMETPGVKVVRPMQVMGYDDAPHGHAEVAFDGVVVPVENLILGEGRGFEIAQGRLGPGRLHHCMRLVGACERSVELMAARGLERRVFGGRLADQGGFQQRLAECRVDLTAARLLVLAASDALDKGGFKGAKGAIGVAKVAVPRIAQRIVDAAMQAHGGAGVSQDTPLARFWAQARTLRIADGPDEVHLGTLAKLELSRAAKAAKARSKL